MIIFYNKETGKIEGTIDARIHNEQHLKMWIGDRDKTERLIIPWKVTETKEVDQKITVMEPIKNTITENGEPMYRKVQKMVKKKVSIWKPQHKQAETLEDIDRRRDKIRNYKIDVKTKMLINKV